jgi:hypothetical protein
MNGSSERGNQNQRRDDSFWAAATQDEGINPTTDLLHLINTEFFAAFTEHAGVIEHEPDAGYMVHLAVIRLLLENNHHQRAIVAVIDNPGVIEPRVPRGRPRNRVVIFDTTSLTICGFRVDFDEALLRPEVDQVGEVLKVTKADAERVSAVQTLKQQGKTQAEAARELGLPTSTVHRYWSKS